MGRRQASPKVPTARTALRKRRKSTARASKRRRPRRQKQPQARTPCAQPRTCTAVPHTPCAQPRTCMTVPRTPCAQPRTCMTVPRTPRAQPPTILPVSSAPCRAQRTFQPRLRTGRRPPGKNRRPAAPPCITARGKDLELAVRCCAGERFLANGSLAGATSPRPRRPARARWRAGFATARAALESAPCARRRSAGRLRCTRRAPGNKAPRGAGAASRRAAGRP